MLGAISNLNYLIASAVSWLNLYMVLLTFVIVVLRYCFGLGWVWLQELTLYFHAIIFMAAAAHTLGDNQHVKVDIFYSKASARVQGLTWLFGTLFFLYPFCAVVFWYSLEFVTNSWKVYEKSGDANGLPGLFLIKSLLLIYPVLLFIQGIPIIFSALRVIRKGE